MPIIYGTGAKNAGMPSNVGTNAPGNPYGTNYGASGVYGPGSYGYSAGVPANAYGQPGLNPYASGGSAYTVGGNPFAGNIYAGIPTTIAGTPYGSQIAAAKKYLYNPQQLRGIANQQAGAQTNAQLQMSYANQTSEQAVLQAQQQRAAGLAAALGSFGPEYGQAMQSAYNQAANTVGQFGTGAVAQGGQAMTDAQNQAQASATAQTGGQGLVQSYNVPDITGTLTQTGVNIPGNSLAVSGLNAAQMGIYGAEADKGYALNTVDYYRQQAMDALQQRAAERAGIIAQRPELFQNALEAQRQDNYQTQNRIDTLVGNATDWINTRRGTAVTTAQAQSQWLLGQSALTKVNPFTGQPTAGYTWADKAHTTIVPWNQLASYKTQMAGVAATNRRTGAMVDHYNDLNQHYNDMYNLGQRQINAKQFAAKQPGKFNPQLSAYLHKAVDSQGRPLVDAKGNPIPYQAPKKPPKAMSITDQAKLVGPMAAYVDGMAKGTPANAKTGAAKIDPIPLETAVQNLSARGWFSTAFQANASIRALAASYGVSPTQIGMMLGGYNPAGGTAGTSTMAGQPSVGTPGTGYGPEVPGGAQGTDTTHMGAGQPVDPNYPPGKTWNPKADPAAGYVGTQIRTKSGHIVDQGKYVS